MKDPMMMMGSDEGSHDDDGGDEGSHDDDKI